MRSSLLLVPLLSVFVAQSAWAQLRRPEQYGRAPRPQPAVSLMAGPALWDDGTRTGTGPAVALRFDIPTSRVLIIEPGISFFRYRSEIGERISYLLPEISFQAQAPLPVVRPYIGAGLGFSEFLDGRGKSFLTLHGVGGVRIAIAGGWGLRGEARARTINPFKLKEVDLTVGISHTLGPRR
jgi:hypothetical protein